MNIFKKKQSALFYLLFIIYRFSTLVEGTKRSVYLRESPKMMEEPRIEIVR